MPPLLFPTRRGLRRLVGFDITQLRRPLLLQPAAPVLRGHFCHFGPRSAQLGCSHNRSELMHGFHPELGSNRGRQALQFGLGTAVIRFLKRGGNVEPAFEIWIDGLTLRRSNIGRLSGARERTNTMSLSEMIFRRIEIKNFLIALPCRLIRDVPAEFVGINETTRSNGGVDNPWKQLVCNTTGQRSGFMPLVDTRIGPPRECALSALFRFRFPEIEWNNGGDAGIERSSDRSHWTASRNCPQQDDLFRIDIATG